MIVSLKNSFKEFRRDKNKKRGEGVTPTRVSKPTKLRSPGQNVILQLPKVPSGYVHSCI